MQKTCNRCGLTKKITSFYKNSNLKDGHIGVCKICYHERDKGAQKERQKKYLTKERMRKEKERGTWSDQSHISFKSLDFTRDHLNTLNLLEKIGYDITQDIHKQFLQRVLMKYGEVLEPKDLPQDNLTKYYE